MRSYKEQTARILAKLPEANRRRKARTARLGVTTTAALLFVSLGGFALYGSVPDSSPDEDFATLPTRAFIDPVGFSFCECDDECGEDCEIMIDENDEFFTMYGNQ